MDEKRVVDELVVWLGSAPVAWVRRSGLASVVARGGALMLQGSRVDAGGDARVGELLLDVWACALSRGKPVEAACAAAALADWAAGTDLLDAGVIEGRAVDLMLRAGAVASDLDRLPRLRAHGSSVLHSSRRRSAALAGGLEADADRSRSSFAWLELEDAAARSAGEALVAALLVQQDA